VILACEGHGVAFINDFLWNDGNWHLHVFKSGHPGAEAEIGNVSAHATCITSGNGTVDHEFGGIRGGGADFSGVFDEVAANCQATAFFFCFLWGQLTQMWPHVMSSRQSSGTFDHGK
jgi:hypothetical protein